MLEYEAILKRERAACGLKESEVDDLLDAICSQAGQHRRYFLLRPFSSDPDDDLILEAAVSSRSDFIITFNQRDFRGIERLGLRCLTPAQFLILLRE